jgi:hypothetical protein
MQMRDIILSIIVAVVVVIPVSIVRANADVIKAALSSGKLWRVGSSEVHRLVDNEAGVVCYVVPQAFCNGSCAYSPSISCVKQ